MMKRLIALAGLCISLWACAGLSASSPVQWSYGVGSNIDDIWASKTEFSRNGQVFYADRGKGNYGAASDKDIISKEFYWAGGGGLPTDGEPVPDHAVIEVVSFHDKKRYRIKVDLPKNLAQQMASVYQVNGRNDSRNWLYFGLAPGGYYEVLLKGSHSLVKPDILLVRGIAEEVTDDWRDKAIPLSVQFKQRWTLFYKKYGEIFKQYPVPLGMAWAPIMDAYRAAQPKTDIDPVQ